MLCLPGSLLGKGSGAANGGRSLFLGQVATATRIGNSVANTNKQAMSRSYHVARDNITSLQIVIANWYNVSNAETNQGGTLTITASIEYPASTFTQVKFASSASIVAADGSTTVSDAVAVTIPKGAAFFVRMYQVFGFGMFYSGVNSNSGLGEGLTAGASGVVDQTMSGTVGTTGGAAIYPAAIIAQTRAGSVAILGDSRAYGIGDSYGGTTTNDIGNLARSIGPTNAYLNLSCPGDKATSFLASNAKRLALTAYCSHVVSNYAINDLIASRTAAQLEADTLSIAALFPGKPVYNATSAPITTGAWTAADGSDQTIDATSNPNRVLFNNWLRGTPGGNVRGFFELADVVESSRDSGKWKADGTVAKYTADGAHESQFAYLLQQSSGAISAAAFR